MKKLDMDPEWFLSLLIESREKLPTELYKKYFGILDIVDDNIKNEALLQDDLAMDSLSMVSLLIGIEDVFEIELDEADMNPFGLGTVQDVVDLVEKYVGE